MLTETHLNPNIEDSEIAIKDYDCHRCDRKERSHGGVLIYCKSDHKCMKIGEYSDGSCEVLGVLVKNIKTLIILTYRPPSSGNEESFNKVNDWIQAVINDHSSYVEDVILGGDMNFPFIEWPGGFFEGMENTKDKEKIQGKMLLDMTEYNGLEKKYNL